MSKKAIVRFNPEDPEAKSSDFLSPVRDDSEALVLLGLRTGSSAKFGLVVYTGQRVTPQDIFAKLVDSGRRIESVDETLADLEAFVQEVNGQRIGTVVELCLTDENARGFSLKETAQKARAKKNKDLP